MNIYLLLFQHFHKMSEVSFLALTNLENIGYVTESEHSIEHYYTTERVTPNHLSVNDKTVVFSNISVAILSGQIVYSFN